MIYKKLYYSLVNAITDAIILLKNNDPDGACAALIAAQQQAEDAYIEDGEK